MGFFISLILQINLRACREVSITLISERDMKKILVPIIFASSLTLTGCLDEILASLCESLASNNTIVASLLTQNDYSNLFAVVTYRNETNFANPAFVGDTDYTVSDCENAFSFPNGERKTLQGSGPSSSISMVTILDNQGLVFFTKNGVLNTEDDFSVSAVMYASCDQGLPVAGSNDPSFATASNNTLVWQGGIGAPEVPPQFAGIEECSLTGETAIVDLAEVI